MVTWLPRIPRLERRHGTVGTRPRHRRSSFQIPARESITSLIASIMLFYPTIERKYFVKTQTYVALFGPHELSIFFSGVMYLELSPL